MEAFQFLVPKVHIKWFGRCSLQCIFNVQDVQGIVGVSQKEVLDRRRRDEEVYCREIFGL